MAMPEPCSISCHCSDIFKCLSDFLVRPSSSEHCLSCPHIYPHILCSRLACLHLELESLCFRQLLRLYTNWLLNSCLYSPPLSIVIFVVCLSLSFVVCRVSCRFKHVEKSFPVANSCFWALSTSAQLFTKQLRSSLKYSIYDNNTREKFKKFELMFIFDNKKLQYFGL